jgi:hypothetical protein
VALRDHAREFGDIHGLRAMCIKSGVDGFLPRLIGRAPSRDALAVAVATGAAGCGGRSVVCGR